MTVTPTAHAIRKAPILTPYVVIWSAFGALSLGLLMVLGLAPEWLDDLRPATTMADPQSNQGQRAAARLASDLSQLKDSVAQIQLDLSKVKTDVASQSEEQKAVAAQVTSLEQRFATAQPVAKIETAVPTNFEQPETVTPPVVAAPVAAAPSAGTTDAVKSPARVPKVINAEAAAPSTVVTSVGLETGSVSGQTKAAATDAISFGPAIVKQAPKPVGVKISSGASVDSLRLSWSMLADKHSDALKSLEARYLTGGDDLNPIYDLVAGPIKSRAEAAKVCKALVAKGVTCTVGNFDGEAL